MWWKFLVGLALGLFCGSLAIAPLFLTGHQERGAFSLATPDFSSQKFSRLTAEEINRRTLKAAAAIDGSRRRF